MSTHAVIKIKMSGEVKSTYVHSDGYFQCLGKNLLKFLRKRENLNKLKEVFPKIKLVDDSSTPTTKELIDMGKFNMPKMVYGGDKYEWYNILHSYQGDLSFYIEDRDFYPMCDGDNYCEEYNYIIDLDNNTIEFSNYDSNLVYNL